MQGCRVVFYPHTQPSHTISLAKIRLYITRPISVISDLGPIVPNLIVVKAEGQPSFPRRSRTFPRSICTGVSLNEIHTRADSPQTRSATAAANRTASTPGVCLPPDSPPRSLNGASWPSDPSMARKPVPGTCTSKEAPPPGNLLRPVTGTCYVPLHPVNLLRRSIGWSF